MLREILLVPFWAHFKEKNKYKKEIKDEIHDRPKVIRIFLLKISFLYLYLFFSLK